MPTLAPAAQVGQFNANNAAANPNASNPIVIAQPGPVGVNTQPGSALNSQNPGTAMNIQGSGVPPQQGTNDLPYKPNIPFSVPAHTPNQINTQY